MAGETLSTLDKIRVKVRLLTSSPSQSQISDQTIDDYVNTFVLYDFPEALKHTYLRSIFTFFTSPNEDTYSTTDAPSTDQFYNFKNKYQVVNAPVYIAGRISMFTQSREHFYAMYPQIAKIFSFGTGNGANTHFTGTLSPAPVLPRSVSFVSADINNNPIILKDDGDGNLKVPGLNATQGLVNYLTGAFDFFFPVAPRSGAEVRSQSFGYIAGLPQVVLFYENKFTLRPVPDSSYEISLEVFQRPVALLSSSQEPELAEWWQYIAYGAAKKVLEDRKDMDTVSVILPAFLEQQSLINNRIAAQQSESCVATIYNQGPGPGSFFWFNNNV